ncbi:MAG: DUF3343 domain-containing protein [Anaerolineae bacterium]|nr:DUF3343 domain-containing protein [Anaerolineae bacterium]
MGAKQEGAYSVVLFFSTSHALKGEKILCKAGIGCKLIPVPRHLSSDCGVCLRVAREDREATLQFLIDGDVEFEGDHDV